MAKVGPSRVSDANASLDSEMLAPRLVGLEVALSWTSAVTVNAPSPWMPGCTAIIAKAKGGG